MSLYQEAEPNVLIRCHGCYQRREVSARQARRIARGVHGNLCFWCRTGSRALSHDRYLRYWLVWAGVSLRPGASPRAYIEEYGVPLALVDLADDLCSFFEL